MQACVVSRRPGPLVLNAVHAATWQSISKQLEGSRSSWLFSDLSLGAWQSHQAASEFGRQLGIALPVSHDWDPEPCVDSLPCYADTIGMSIDAEAAGNRTIRKTLALASTIVATARECGPQTFAVLMPRFNSPWSRDDLLFLEFLAMGLEASGSRLVLVNASDYVPALPPNWRVRWSGEPKAASAQITSGLVSLVPGIVEQDVAQALAGPVNTHVQLVPLGGNRWLVAPECRQNPETVSRLEYDRLAARAHALAWLRAYAQVCGNSYHVEPFFLSRQAWQRFAEGGESLALRLIERALPCASTPHEVAILQAGAQGMRIAMRAFEEVIMVADPGAGVPAPLRGFLLQAKGWGYVMANEASRAELYLERAQPLLGAYSNSREVQYLQNISALNRLRLGDVDGALRIEDEIAANLGSQERPDHRLQYVNAINLARLHRRRGDFQRAEQAYQRAFATTLGVRTENDAIYRNVCDARLNADRGRSKDAFLCWLRAGLHWAASDVPEALSPRVAGAILNRSVTAQEIVCEDVSATLLTILCSALGNLEQEWPALVAPDADLDTWPPPVFLRADQICFSQASNGLTRAIGGDGWSLLVHSGAAATAPYIGRSHRRLRSLLNRLLTSPGTGQDVLNPAAIIVDDRLGHEMATNQRELVETCLRLGSEEMFFESAAYQLNRDVRRRLEEQLWVRWGDAVEGVEFRRREAVVTYKRYWHPRRLSEEDSRVLQAVESGASGKALQDLEANVGNCDSLLPVLRGLERARIVQLWLPGDVACV